MKITDNKGKEITLDLGNVELFSPNSDVQDLVLVSERVLFKLIEHLSKANLGTIVRNFRDILKDFSYSSDSRCIGDYLDLLRDELDFHTTVESIEFAKNNRFALADGSVDNITECPHEATTMECRDCPDVGRCTERHNEVEVASNEELNEA